MSARLSERVFHALHSGVLAVLQLHPILRWVAAGTNGHIRNRPSIILALAVIVLPTAAADGIKLIVSQDRHFAIAVRRFLLSGDFVPAVTAVTDQKTWLKSKDPGSAFDDQG